MDALRTPFDAPPRLGERAIRQRVGDASFERGRLYFESGAVFDARRDGRAIKARCEGSSGDAYRVRAEFDARGVAHAHCSCPVGDAGRCKHVAALLIAWQRAEGEFVEVRSVERSLAHADRDALADAVARLVRARPELEPTLELLLSPGAARRDAAPSWRQRAAAAFREHAGDLGAASSIAQALGSLADAADAALRDGRVRDAAEGHAAVACAVLARSRRIDDEEGALTPVARRAIDALGGCLAEAGADERAAVLEALFRVFRFDVEDGGRGPARRVAEVVARCATAADRRLMADWVRDARESAPAWACRVYERFLVDLATDTVDDEAYLQLCRAAGRTRDLVARLLERDRVPDALAEAERATDAELVSLADVFAQHQRGDAVVPLVSARADRSAAAPAAPTAPGADTAGASAPTASAAAANDNAGPAPDAARLLAWLKDYHAARCDDAGVLAAGERLFRVRPDLASYQELRALATRLKKWKPTRARLLAALTRRNAALLAEVLLEEGELDAAVAALSPEACRGPAAQRVRPRVADAIEPTRPRDAAELHRRQAEELIAARGRPNYREARRHLERARALHERVGDLPTWDAYAAALRAKHGDLPALLEELAGLLPDAATPPTATPPTARRAS